MNLPRLLATLLFALVITGQADDGSVVQTLTHKVTGLCCPERVEDLRDAVKDQAEVKLVSIDYAHAEATFAYAPKVFSTERLRQLLGIKGFGFKAPSTTPADQLTRIEIPIFGLDCKGCSLGAYNAVIKVDGVEQANASFKEGHVTALIDPAKTNRSALEEALKKARVALAPPEEAKAP
jgi:copper chaperone CopZ